MRVALDALAVDPARPGGDASYVRALVQHLPLVDDDLQLTVFVERSARPLFAASVPHVRYVTCTLPWRSLVLRALWEQAVLPTFVRRAQPDVVHSPINVSPLAISTPTVLTLHEAEPFMPDNRIPVPLLLWWRVMRRASAHRARLVLVVSESAKSDVERWMRVPASRIRAIPLAVDHRRFAPGPALAHRDKPFILWVGRPYPHKGLVTLIRAFAQLRTSGRREALILAGPPGWTDTAIADELRRLDCAEDVQRLPAITNDLQGWYRAASVFAFPSERESFGLPVLEAMACGTPTVAGDIRALRDVGGDAVLYAAPGDDSALAHALNRVLSEPALRSRLADAGPKRAAAFSWSETARRTALEYRRVVADPGT
jgi:glycosyltransferase involved in cell wall biosynthesis